MEQVREALEQSKTRIAKLIFVINQEIIHSWSDREIMYVDAYFSFLRHQADLLIKPEKKSVLYQQERQIREYLSKLLGCSKKTELTAMMAQIRSDVSERLHELERYKIQIAGESCRYVYHTSAVKDLVYLNASKKKENMYNNEVVDAVFGTTDYDQLVLYLGRAVAGGMHVIQNGHICVYPIDPVKEVRGEEVILKQPVYLYWADIRYFEPVIDFRVQNHRVELCFEYEWIARRPYVPCKGKKIERISLEDWRKHKIYYSTGLQDEISLSEEYKKAMSVLEVEKTMKRLIIEKKLVQDRATMKT